MIYLKRPGVRSTLARQFKKTEIKKEETQLELARVAKPKKSASLSRQNSLNRSRSFPAPSDKLYMNSLYSKLPFKNSPSINSPSINSPSINSASINSTSIKSPSTNSPDGIPAYFYKSANKELRRTFIVNH